MLVSVVPAAAEASDALTSEQASTEAIMLGLGLAVVLEPPPAVEPPQAQIAIVAATAPIWPSLLSNLAEVSRRAVAMSTTTWARLAPDHARRPEAAAISGAGRRAQQAPLLTSRPVSQGRRDFQLDVVGVAKRENADPERRQLAHVAVGHTALVELADRLVQRGTALHAEAEVVEADAVLVEAVALLGDGPESQQVVPLRHHDPSPEHWVGRIRRWVGRLLGGDGDVEPEKGRVELATPLDVGHRQPYVVDAAQLDLPRHCQTLP